MSHQTKEDLGHHPLEGLGDVLGEDREATKDEEVVMLDKLYRQIARSVESKVRSSADFSLGRFPLKIKNIKTEKDRLLISISIPFLVLLDEDPHLRRELKRVREGFVVYLTKKENEKQLSSFFYKQLAGFLIEIYTSKRFSPEIMKLLRRFTQRTLAGRPSRVVPADASRYIKQEGKSVLQSIRNIQVHIGDMKRHDKRLTNGTVLKKLRREFPSRRYPWIQEFLALKDNLPRRRYSPSTATHEEIPESVDPDGKLPPCGLSEPENWSTLEITTRVIQAKLLTETKVRYPLRAIRDLLKAK